MLPFLLFIKSTNPLSSEICLFLFISIASMYKLLVTEIERMVKRRK